LVRLAEGNRNDFVRPSPERYDPELRQGSIIAAEHRVRYRWAAMAAEGQAVLDAGCGAGYGSAILADAGARRVTGLDIDPGAVAGAASSYGQRGGIEFVRGDVRELPFADRSFDLIVCFETIEHVEEPDTALDELRRVLRDEGHLLLSSPNRDVFPPGNPHHVYEYVPRELEDALSRRFGSVELWRQQTWLASMLLNDDAARAGPDAEVEAKIRNATPLEPGEELYTVAIAGARPLVGLRGAGMLCEPLEIKRLVTAEIETGRTLQQTRREAGERERELQQRERELHLAREKIAGHERDVARQGQLIERIGSSFSWRVTAPLRAGKAFAKRVAGPRSHT
jgi:SAM-dependent methyltransferase